MEYLEQLKIELQNLKLREGILENVKKECSNLNIAENEKAKPKRLTAIIKRRPFGFSAIAASLVVVITLSILLPVLLIGSHIPEPDGYTAGLEYKIINNSFYEVSLGNATDKDIKIAPEYNGLPVQRIAKDGFTDSNIKSIIIPESVDSIEGNAAYDGGELSEGAFFGCENLTGVTLPASLESIGVGAFAECKSLETITIPRSVQNIGGGSFYGSGLKTIAIPSGINIIETNLFAYCDNLANVSIPYSVKHIKDGAFAYCGSLEKITISDNVETIGAGAFSNCANLGSITIPKSVISIGTGAFSNCEKLKIYCEVENKPEDWAEDWTDSEVDWKTELSVLSYALINNGSEYEVSKGGKSADVIIIPANHNGIPVTSIADNAFSYSNIVNCVIPNSVKNIGEKAFYECGFLKSITIHKSVSVIKKSAFEVSENISDITIYAEAESKPAGWLDEWSSSKRPIVWSCELLYDGDKPYVNSFKMTKDIQGTSFAYSAPYRAGYNFNYWRSIFGREYKAEDIYKASNRTTLTAIWKEV